MERVEMWWNIAGGFGRGTGVKGRSLEEQKGTVKQGRRLCSLLPRCIHMGLGRASGLRARCRDVGLKGFVLGCRNVKVLGDSSFPSALVRANCSHHPGVRGGLGAQLFWRAEEYEKMGGSAHPPSTACGGLGLCCELFAAALYRGVRPQWGFLCSGVWGCNSKAQVRWMCG